MCRSIKWFFRFQKCPEHHVDQDIRFAQCRQAKREESKGRCRATADSLHTEQASPTELLPGKCPACRPGTGGDLLTTWLEILRERGNDVAMLVADLGEGTDHGLVWRRLADGHYFDAKNAYGLKEPTPYKPSKECSIM